MFWRVSGLNAGSPVDSILDKDSFTLEELLDEDELIQECKSLNARLTAYLKQKDTVERLLRYLVQQPLPGCNDPKQRFKYPFAACEIFCCEVEGICNTLLENDDLLALLFSILQHARPLDCMLAGYFSRVVGSLLLRRTQELMDYLSCHRELLNIMVDHVGTTSIAEVLVRLVGADDQRAIMCSNHMQWLADTQLLYLLLEKLQPGAPADARANASEILAAVARAPSSPLSSGLYAADFLSLLCSQALVPEPEVASHALEICLALLDPLPPAIPDNSNADAFGGVQLDLAALQQREAGRNKAIELLSQRVAALVALVEGPPPASKLSTSYGFLRPPVGTMRLKAVALLAALFRTAHPTAEAAVMSTQGVQSSMSLFLAAPFNNVLHRYVVDVVTAFECCSQDGVRFLLDDCHLLDWVTQAPVQVTPEQPENRQTGGCTTWRAGYYGHILQIANRLLQASQAGTSSSVLADALRAHSGWQCFLTEVLEPQNALESVFAWQCGRPSLHEPVADGEMFQTELDFGSTDSTGLSSNIYKRYGGFENEDWAETPPWAVALTVGADAISSADAGAAKLMQTPLVPDSWDSSSSESDSDDELGRPGAHATRDIPASNDDESDMVNDAVLLADNEAAEQMTRLSQQLQQGLDLTSHDSDGNSGHAAIPLPDMQAQQAEFAAATFWRRPELALTDPELE